MNSSADPKGWALLKLGDLMLVVPQKYTRVENPDYFYHSRQCAVNLLRDVQQVYDPEYGADPHGRLRYVASIDHDREVAVRLESGVSYAELLAIFRTDGQPPASDWPERNGGMISWIADAQRESRSKS